MTTAWSHLPNAKYIDLVIESIKKYPSIWNKISKENTTMDNSRYEAWIKTWNAVNNTMDIIERLDAFDAARDITQIIASKQYPRLPKGALRIRNTARDVIITLITYEDCAHLLYSDPKEVELLAKLGSIPAILLLPACIVFNETKELV